MENERRGGREPKREGEGGRGRERDREGEGGRGVAAETVGWGRRRRYTKYGILNYHVGLLADMTNFLKVHRRKMTPNFV